MHSLRVCLVKKKKQPPIQFVSFFRLCLCRARERSGALCHGLTGEKLEEGGERPVRQPE